MTTRVFQKTDIKFKVLIIRSALFFFGKKMNFKKRTLKPGTNSYKESDLYKKTPAVTEEPLKYEERVITLKCAPLLSFTYIEHGIVKFKKVYAQQAPQNNAAEVHIVKEKEAETHPDNAIAADEIQDYSTIEDFASENHDLTGLDEYLATIEDQLAQQDEDPAHDIFDFSKPEETASTIETTGTTTSDKQITPKSFNHILKIKTKKHGEFNKSKFKKPQVNLFETVVDEREQLKEEIYKKINYDGYYDEIKAEDADIEFVHKEKKKVHNAVLIPIIGLGGLGLYLIISNIIALVK